MPSSDIIERLANALRPPSEESDEAAEAAVALLLKPSGDDLRIFFVKRVENPADPWSGQMAFPGGKRDPQDQNLKQTVIRETFEETRINLHGNCRFLGALTPLRSTQRPEMRVLPFIILLEREPSIDLNEELEWYVWISAEELAQHKGQANLNFGEVPAFIIGDSVIWGLTYRILEKFFHLLGGPS